MKNIIQLVRFKIITQLFRIISQVNKLSNVQKHTRMNVYKFLSDSTPRYGSVLTESTLCYGSETWSITTRDKRRTAAQMRFLGTAGYSLFDHKRNKTITKVLSILPSEYLDRYRQNLLCHFTRYKIPRPVLYYIPRGRKVGRSS